LFVGIALMLWSVNELWQIGTNSYLGLGSGAFKVTLISVSYSLLCIVGSLGLLFKKIWGKIIILSAAGISVLYTVTYFLMGGFNYTGPIYAVNVSGLSVLSVATFIIIGRKTRQKG